MGGRAFRGAPESTTGDASPRSAQHEGGAQPRRPAPDHGYVIGCLCSWSPTFDRRPLCETLTFCCCFRDPLPSVTSNGRKNHRSLDVLAEVGPRLKRLRTATRHHLDGTRHEDRNLPRARSRGLETGQRKPSLELLLPLAEAHQVPLDDSSARPK